MHIRSLGYVGLPASSVAAWKEFASEFLGMEAHPVAGKQGALTLRMDERCHRFIIQEGTDRDYLFFGFELAELDDLSAAVAELSRLGYSPKQATQEELELRRVNAMVRLKDPAGYNIEFFVGLENAPTAFKPGWPMAGFHTGELGVGHAAVVAPDLEASKAFYCDVLKFRVSDFINHPGRRIFMRCNGRHHSWALAGRSGYGIGHLMVEFNELDDVGRAYDRVLSKAPELVHSSFGRHTNDHMISFYVRTPNGFGLEVGWGGQIVDDLTWVPRELISPSLWGHDRLGAPPEIRAAANAQRSEVAAMGLRAPIQVIDSPAFDLTLVKK